MLGASGVNALVTVILPTYQRAAYLRQSLESLLAQTVAAGQIIVVDDGSTDETARILADYAERITVLHKANGGKPSAINLALPLVRGDYIWIFDDDDIACVDALSRHTSVLVRRPEVGFTYSACYRCHNDPVSGALITDGAFPVRPFADDEYYLELLLSSYVAGPAVMVRADVQRRAGAYREDMLRSEDLEMATRWGLLAIGARLDQPHPSYYRRDHPGARGGADDRFDSNLSSSRARDYERKLITGLSATLDLRHYLPHSLWGEALTAERATRARFRRWVVYTQKGLWQESVAALAQLADLDLAAPPTAADVHVIGLRALQDMRTLRELAPNGEVMRALAALLRRPRLRELRRTLMRQLYYHARVALRRRDRSALALIAVAATGLFGGPLARVRWPSFGRTHA